MSVLDRIAGTEEPEAPPPGVLDRVSGLNTRMSQVVADVGEAAQSVSDVFTGDQRATPNTENTPEVLFEGSGLFEGENPKDLALITPALSTATNDAEFGQIVAENFPNIGMTFDKDAQGNPVAFLTNNRTGARAIINRPGISGTDLFQGSALAAAFTPAGRVGSAATAAGQAARVAGQSGATETVIQGTQAASGGDFDTSDVALSTGLGGAVQLASRRLAEQFPSLRQSENFEQSQEARRAVRAELIRLGVASDEITEDVITDIARRAKDAANPGEAAALAGEREFGIRLSEGGRTLDPRQVSFEDSARTGALGDRAQEPFLAFDAGARRDVDSAIQRQADDLGGVRQTREEAGQTVIQGTRRAEEIADNAVDQAYAEVGEASLSIDSMNKLFNATRKAMLGIDKDRALPETQKILGLARSIQRRWAALRETPVVLRDVDIRQIEQFRKRLNGAIDSAESTDKRQIVQMKRAFDDKLDEAVVNGLFSGDQGALDALKNARATFREYARVFRSNPTTTRSGRTLPDRQGALIEKIVEANPTGAEVVNGLFGAQGINNAAGVGMASRFREILGPDSEGWAAIRQEAFRRLVVTRSVNGSDVVSGQQSLTALNRALDKSEGLIREIFTPEEVSTMRRLFGTIQRTEPAALISRENPSGTGQKVSRILQQALPRLSGLMSGDLSLAVTSQGLEMASRFRSGGRARQAVRPFEGVVVPRAELVGAAQGVSQVQ